MDNTNAASECTKHAYDAWHERLSVDSSSDAPWHRLVKNRLLSSRDLDGKRILEIGCGRGGFAVWLASQVGRPAQIVAADFSPSAIQKGRTHADHLGLSGITWEIGNIQAIAHSSSSFDTVISCETIEHVPDPARAVRELARVLKPRGRLFLTTPNYLGTLGLYRCYCRLRGRPYTEEAQPINRLMLLPKTRMLVTRSGLKIDTIDAVGHYLPFPGRPPVEFPACNNPRSVMRWFALHSIVIAEKV
jgi:2-polyprenyl-3-methyl-5-hydroxy-6-metoxy-1,4-benzoquinol methylase